MPINTDAEEDDWASLDEAVEMTEDVEAAVVVTVVAMRYATTMESVEARLPAMRLYVTRKGVTENPA
jgi:hypothetical protein